MFTLGRCGTFVTMATMIKCLEEFLKNHKVDAGRDVNLLMHFVIAAMYYCTLWYVNLVKYCLS